MNQQPIPGALELRTRQAWTEGIEQEAAAGLLAAAGRLRLRYNVVCAQFGITHEQLNLLQILRSAYPEGYPRHEIANRLVERAPDVTRLIDRLERNGLVERYRSTEDRRLSVTRISRMGLVLLEQMDEPIGAARREYMQSLRDAEIAHLSRLCGTLYNRK